MASRYAALTRSAGGAAALPRAIAAMPRWSLLLLAALAARAFAYGNPIIHTDEEFYFVTAQRMLHGAIPYVDIWDRKPVGLFLLYMPAAAFGVPAGIWVYQAMATLSVVLTALLIAHLADRAGWRKGALVAAILYIFMLDFADGQGGQAPIFYNLPMIAAVALIVPRAGETVGDTRRRARALGALLLVGIAMQIKYSVLFEGVFLGLWLMWREYRLGARRHEVLGLGVVLVAAAMLPTLAAWGSYIALGYGDAFFYANFGSILDRQSDPFWTLTRAALKVSLILAPLLIVSGLSTRVPVERLEERPVRQLYFGWLIAAVLGLIVFGSWFNHYSLPVMAPGALCCAGFLGSGRAGRRVSVAMLVAGLAGGILVLQLAAYHRGSARQLEALAQAIGHGPGCLYVHSGNAMLYGYTGRCAVSSWLFPSHLSRERENGALGVDQIAEVDRIFTRKPEFVVMRPPFNGERKAVRARVMRLLRVGGYRPAGTYPVGDTMIALFRLPSRAATKPE